MKNKIFRRIIATALVLAMMLTFVACASSTPTQTVSPTVAVTPTPTEAPTETPEVAETQTPSTSDKKDDLSSDFGLSITGVSGVFGTDLEDADGEEISPGYFEILWDVDKTTEQHYSINYEFELSGDNADYEFSVFIPNVNTTTQLPSYTLNGTKYSFSNIAATGEAPLYYKIIDGIVVQISEGEMIIKLEDADEYELSADIEITDMAEDFGAWSEEDTTVFELSMSAEMEIEKQEITIEIAPAVIEENENSLEVVATSTYSKKYNTEIADDVCTVYLPKEFTFDNITIGIQYDMSYVKEAVPGVYAVEISEAYTYGGNSYSDLDDLNDDLINYEVVAVKDTSIIVLSEYDYTELADVITSIAEIYFAYTAEYSYTFFGDAGNIEVQLPLAVERYNNLSSNQRAFFDTYASVNFANYTSGYVGTFLTYARKVDEEAPYEDENLPEYDSNLSNDDAMAIGQYLEYAQAVYADYVVYTAFDKYAEEAELPLSGFNVNNSNHTSSFELVDSYFNGLSDKDQERVETENSKWYIAYQNAKNALDLAEVDGVEQLIVGAYAAYIKAIPNSKVIYQDNVGGDVVSKWSYIQSTEVITLTNQAKEAYDNLSDYGKDYLENQAGADSDIFGYSSLVAFQSGENSMYNALEQLLAMNEMIETMVQISQYVNIEDYATSEIPYSRLNALVYGVNRDVYDDGEYVETVLGGLYFPTYSGDTDAVDYRFAMQDIINAPTRNYDAIISEYQEWLTYVTKIETYKTTALMEFVTQIAFEVDKLDTDDYSEAVLSKAEDSSNIVSLLIVSAIMYEYIDIYVTDEYSMTFINGGYILPDVFDFEDIVEGNSGVNIIPFFYEGFLEDKDSFDDVYESYEDFMDLDDLVESYIDAIKEK